MLVALTVMTCLVFVLRVWFVRNTIFMNEDGTERTCLFVCLFVSTIRPAKVCVYCCFVLVVESWMMMAATMHERAGNCWNSLDDFRRRSTIHLSDGAGLAFKIDECILSCFFLSSAIMNLVEKIDVDGNSFESSEKAEKAA